MSAVSAGGPTRSDTWSAHVTIAGKDWGIWDGAEGGEVDSEDGKFKPGNMQDEVSLGGSKTTGNMTMKRLYRLKRDHTQSQSLIDGAGRARVVIVKQPLDVEGIAFGKPFIYRGTLKRVKFPDHDSMSNDPGMLEIEVTCDSPPHVG
jgi:hypothetical protein